jgi:hypothetical protein
MTVPPDATVDYGSRFRGSPEGFLESTVEFQALHRETQQGGDAR